MSKVATVHWTTGLSFRGESGSGGQVELEGEQTPGMRPTELLLAALAGCTGMDVISILGKKRLHVEGYRVRVQGEQTGGQPSVFRSIVVEHEVQGESIEPEAVRRSIELSATRYCTVSAQLSAGDLAISHRYLLHNRAGEHRAEVVVTGPRSTGLTPVDDRAPARAGSD